MENIRKKIEAYLKSNTYCVLCTCAGDRPRATPVRYTTDGLHVIIYSEKFTRKFSYLKKNTRVAIALHSTQGPIRGIQLWGTAEVIPSSDPRHSAYLFPEAKRSPKLAKACRILHLVYVVPSRIVMLEQVPKKGYRYYVWQQTRVGAEKTCEVKTIRELSRLSR